METIKNQSELTTNAVGWLLAHPVRMEGLYDPKGCSDEIIEKELERAIQEKDHVYYALLLYRQSMQEHKKRRTRRPNNADQAGRYSAPSARLPFRFHLPEK